MDMKSNSRVGSSSCHDRDRDVPFLSLKVLSPSSNMESIIVPFALERFTPDLPCTNIMQLLRQKHVGFVPS